MIRIVCAFLLIFSAVVAFLCFGQGWHQLDPDYNGYKAIFETSTDLSDKPVKLFYGLGYLVHHMGGSYTVFRALVLSISVSLTVASILLWSKKFQFSRVGYLHLSVLILALIPFVLENYYVRIRIGLAEPLITIALGFMLCVGSNVKENLRNNKSIILIALALLFSSISIHLEGGLLVISVALVLMGLMRFSGKFTILLSLLMGIGVTILVDWQAQFRHEILYSKYHIARYLTLNVGELILVVLLISLKPRLQKLNYFDLFLIFYTGITIGIAMILAIHPVVISGEALVRFQSAFAMIALLGALYASPRLNLVWLYILLVNGAFFMNSIITPFFDVKKIFA